MCPRDLSNCLFVSGLLPSNFRSNWQTLMKNSLDRRVLHVRGNNVCENCGKSYSYQRGLKQHQRYECGKEPMFQCPYCPKKCFQPVNLKTHIKRCKNLQENNSNDSFALSDDYN